MNVAPVFHGVKFSMAEIAKAVNVELLADGGISYGVLKLQIPLNNGTILEFRQGDDEYDHEVSILPNQKTLDDINQIGKPFKLSCYDLVSKLKEDYLKRNPFQVGNELWHNYNNWNIHSANVFKEFINACKESPSYSAKCGICSGLNLLFDDCGFFYKKFKGDYIPYCEKCGKPNTCER